MTPVAAAAGHIFAAAMTPGWHVVPWTIGAFDAPALCGVAPSARWNPVTREFDGPSRWGHMQRRLDDIGGVCETCRERMGQP